MATHRKRAKTYASTGYKVAKLKREGKLYHKQDNPEQIRERRQRSQRLTQD